MFPAIQPVEGFSPNPSSLALVRFLLALIFSEPRSIASQRAAFSTRNSIDR